jgi:hypothetical protein
MTEKKSNKKPNNEGNFETWEKNKNFVVLDDVNMAWVKRLRDEIKGEVGVSLTYNTIVGLVLISSNKKLLTEKVNMLKEALKGGIEK